MRCKARGIENPGVLCWIIASVQLLYLCSMVKRVAEPLPDVWIQAAEEDFLDIRTRLLNICNELDNPAGQKIPVASQLVTELAIAMDFFRGRRGGKPSGSP